MFETLTREKWIDRAGIWYATEPNTGCWLWLGPLSYNGYSVFRSRALKTRSGHRTAYMLFRGPIPEGLQIDHLCRQRSCVNPDHMEIVTQRENLMRGIGITAQCAKKTHCLRGHEFTPENTCGYRGWRSCRECMRIRARARYARKTGKPPMQATLFA